MWFLGSSKGEICKLLLLISDFYLSCWRNSSVTISDQSVRRVTTNHLCHEELITRDSLFWSLIVTPLWHHSLSPQSLWWQHSTVHSHWLQFSQTLDCVSTWHQCWQHDRHPGTDWGWPLLPLTNIRTRGNILDKVFLLNKFIRISSKRMELIKSISVISSVPRQLYVIFSIIYQNVDTMAEVKSIRAIILNEIVQTVFAAIAPCDQCMGHGTPPGHCCMSPGGYSDNCPCLCSVMPLLGQQ